MQVKQICLCGSKNCSGFIGEKPTRPGHEILSKGENKLNVDKSKGAKNGHTDEKDKNNKNRDPYKII